VVLNSVLDFWSKHNRLPRNLNTDDAAELMKLAKEWQTNKIDQEGFEFEVKELNEKLITNVALYAQTQITPICSFWGGIITQEIVKMTGKYTPLRQWLHHEFNEMLPDSPPTHTPKSSQYSDYTTLFGDAFVKLVS
jgi:ubiquitin-activating enzyme E1